MEPIKWAYHVTDVEAYHSQPHWNELLTNTANSGYDGCLLGRDVVYFSTTLVEFLHGANLPTVSVYPRNGDSGDNYWRVKVPLSTFNDYRIKIINTSPNQVHLLLTHEEENDQIHQNSADDEDNDDASDLEKEEITSSDDTDEDEDDDAKGWPYGVDDESNADSDVEESEAVGEDSKLANLEDITDMSNEYLYRDEDDQWYGNVYDASDPSSKRFVNFAVLHGVLLGPECEWDVVKRL